MPNKNAQLRERPPIIAVLGHVDHGKSSLLDYIRKSNTVASEAGGITQHVAAYEVEHQTPEGESKRITFIDTPGHAAFTAIRARGANIADIAILVVSAEEGVKAQTLEAYANIQESGIPCVVAITKTDLPNADVERAKTSLLENGIYLEGLGGTIPWVAISSKTGEGIPDILNILLLVAAMEELTGNSDIGAEGYVIEANRDPKRGIAATLIITDGSMQTGMAIATGDVVAPLRIMEDHAGNVLREASFSTPVRVTGFDALPRVGAPFRAYANKKDAELHREISATEPERLRQVDSEDTFYLPIIVKADVAGSLEAVQGQLAALGDAHRRIHIILSGIGSISEGDIKAALASEKDARIIGFNVDADVAADDLARQNGIPIETFSIIYKLSERLSEILRESAPKRFVEDIVGRARVLKIFSKQKHSHVIGGKVLEGHLDRNKSVRITRRGEVIGTGRLQNIQTARHDVDQVDADSEFGAQIAYDHEIASGDILESIVEREEV